MVISERGFFTPKSPMQLQLEEVAEKLSQTTEGKNLLGFLAGYSADQKHNCICAFPQDALDICERLEPAIGTVKAYGFIISELANEGRTGPEDGFAHLHIGRYLSGVGYSAEEAKKLTESCKKP